MTMFLEPAGDEPEVSPVFTFDFETDPFLHGREPVPFTAGFKGRDSYAEHWGENAPAWVAEQIKECPEDALIYAHNGGKFDFAFLKDFFDPGDVRVIGARIVEVKIHGRRVRDSYAMIPVPLKAYAKDDIEYWKLERVCREEHKQEILHYQRKDCEYLYELVAGFREEFGIHLTMAGAAIKQLMKFHEVTRTKSDAYDRLFRLFYYGGRVQCFESGIIKAPLEVYDVNSEYPFVMRDYEHPIGLKYNVTRKLENCDFAIINATNYGALPGKDDDGNLTFEKTSGMFHATGHEIRAGLETGTLKVNSVFHAYRFEERGSFAEFVNHFYGARLAAKADGDKLHEIFYKLVLNSSYGKFAQNPEHFKDWKLTDGEPLEYPWRLETELPSGLLIYSRPSGRPSHLSLYNVATAASITGAARAHLLRGLEKATRPIYCDTDSIICERLEANIDPRELGAWKFEGRGDCIAIAGKKLYALRDGDKDIKKASKGSFLSYDEIFRVAGGETIESRSDAPTFSLTKDTRFIKRRIRKTAK